MKPFSQTEAAAPARAGLPVLESDNNERDQAKTSCSESRLDTGALLESAGQLIGQGLRDALAVLQGSAHASELNRRRTEAMEEGWYRELSDRAARLEARIEAVHAGMDAVRGEIVRVGSRLTPLTSHLETVGQNLDQVRLMIERLLRETEELNAELIERHVTDPLYREFGRLLGSLRSLTDNGTENTSAEVSALADSVARFLDASGVSLIDPEPGAAFDPRVHQPLRNSATTDAAQHGTVAKTYQPGLRRKERLIQPARVQIFALHENSVRHQPINSEAKIS